MRWRLLAASAMLAAATGVASAQHIDKERGFTWAVGVGKAWMTTACTECPGRSDTDVGAQFRAGWKYRSNIVIGAEAFVWSNSKFVANETQKISYGSYSAVLLWYPQRHHEYFLKGGFGIAAIKTLDVVGTGGSREIRATPMTGTIGVGADLNLAKRWSVTPFIDYQNGLSAKAKVDGASSDQKLSSSMVIVGVAITVH